MLIEAKDLQDQLGSGGGQPFERFMYDLVAAEAKIHRIPINKIDWDYRTNCPDGGCDIFIDHTHIDPAPLLIPCWPSIWSLKSGPEGIESSALRKELTDSKHTRLREHLTKGHAYVWCALQSASQAKRIKMSQERDRLATELEFDPQHVE